MLAEQCIVQHPLMLREEPFLLAPHTGSSGGTTCVERGTGAMNFESRECWVFYRGLVCCSKRANVFRQSACVMGIVN